MPSFLSLIQAIDNAIAHPKEPQLEPRSVRRQKARDAIKSVKKAA